MIINAKPDNLTSKLLIGIMRLGVILFICLGIGSSQTVRAQDELPPEPNPEYFMTNTIMLADGNTLGEYIINGPPNRPEGFELESRAIDLPEPFNATGTALLSVPAYDWVFGCSATSGAMIAAYYDLNGFPNMYSGPTFGGVMPIDNSSWGTFNDGVSTQKLNPLAASLNGLDGRITHGSIDDYWVAYNSSAPDPYITNWTQHEWGDAIGDYMKTSQSAYQNTDGSTHFFYSGTAASLTCAQMKTTFSSKYGKMVSEVDGTYGRKLFYEARGYAVTDCYSQDTDNNTAGGFSFNQFKAEIDAGRPVLVNLTGHSVVGVGYDDSSNKIYIHDTWDYATHEMTWGGVYDGLTLVSVSIVNIEGSITYTISGNAGVGGATLSYMNVTPKTTSSATDGSYSFSVSLGWSGTVTPTKTGYTFSPVNRPYSNVLANQIDQDYTANVIIYRIFLPLVNR